MSRDSDNRNNRDLKNTRIILKRVNQLSYRSVVCTIRLVKLSDALFKKKKKNCFQLNYFLLRKIDHFVSISDHPIIQKICISILIEQIKLHYDNLLNIYESLKYELMGLMILSKYFFLLQQQQKIN